MSDVIVQKRKLAPIDRIKVRTRPDDRLGVFVPVNNVEVLREGVILYQARDDKFTSVRFHSLENSGRIARVFERHSSQPIRVALSALFMRPPRG